MSFDLQVVFFVVGLCVSIGAGEPCVDIDSQACIVLEQTTPNFCSVAASAVCQKHCGNCPTTSPIGTGPPVVTTGAPVVTTGAPAVTTGAPVVPVATDAPQVTTDAPKATATRPAATTQAVHFNGLKCYDCGHPSLSPTGCRKSVTCGEGEICSARELRASDGRLEYTMGCIPSGLCDGAGLPVPFGRRGLQRRNINIKCCGTSLCNDGQEFATTTKPTTQVPTTSNPFASCSESVFFLVDVANDQSSSTFLAYRNILSGVVQGLDVDHTSSKVTIGTFSERYHSVNTHGAHESNILQAIHKEITPDGHHAELEHALHDLRHHLPRGTTVLVIVSNGNNHGPDHFGPGFEDIQKSNINVISLDIGGHSPIDSKADHVVHMSSPTTTQVKLSIQQLLQLICQ